MPLPGAREHLAQVPGLTVLNYMVSDFNPQGITALDGLLQFVLACS